MGVDAGQVRQNRETWDALASAFDPTRRTPWPGVAQFLATLPKSGLIVDMGSGNGRHAVVAAEAGLRVVLVDVSGRLLRLARGRVPSATAVEGCLESMPLRDAAADGALCLAALHHVRGRRERVASLNELRRIVRPGGPALVSVWARDQARFQEPGARRDVEGPAEEGDAWVPWRGGGVERDRFYHLYAAGELEAEAREAGWSVEMAGSVSWAGAAADNFVAELRRPG